MVYFGRVQNGSVVPERDMGLPEGARVRVEPVVPDTGAADKISGIDPVYRAGDDAVNSGITDMAAEHDHYTYRTPKGGDHKDA